MRGMGATVGTALAVLALTLTACGGAGGPAGLSPEKICELMSDAQLGELIGADDVTHQAGTSSAPNACVYTYQRPVGLDGTASLKVSMLSGDQVDGRTGSEALEYVAEQAGADGGQLVGVEAEHVHTSPGSGDLLLAVDDAGRIVSLLFDSDVSADQQAAVTNAVLGAP